MEESNRNTRNISARPHTHKQQPADIHASQQYICEVSRLFQCPSSTYHRVGWPCLCVSVLTRAGNPGNSCQGTAFFSPWPLALIGCSTCLSLARSLSPVVSHDGVHHFPVCSSSHWSPTAHQLYLLFWACVWTCVYRLKWEQPLAVYLFLLFRFTFLSRNYLSDNSNNPFFSNKFRWFVLVKSEEAYCLQLTTDIHDSISSFVVFTLSQWQVLCVKVAHFHILAPM